MFECIEHMSDEATLYVNTPYNTHKKSENISKLHSEIRGS